MRSRGHAGEEVLAASEGAEGSPAPHPVPTLSVRSTLPLPYTLASTIDSKGLAIIQGRSSIGIASHGYMTGCRAGLA